MNVSFKTRAVLIIGGVLLCLQSAASCQQRGRLTTGTEMVLQAQLQDAFVTVADTSIEQIRNDLRKNNISISAESLTRSEPKTVEEAGKIEIDVKGISPSQAGDFRRIVTGPGYAQWTLTVVSPSDYRMNMTPGAALEISRNTMAAVLKTVQQRLDAVKIESWVEPVGHDRNDAEVMVQFAPTDDPGHVKEVLTTGGILEWNEVKAGPYDSLEEAQHGGVNTGPIPVPVGSKLPPPPDRVMPLNSKIVPENLRGGAGRRYWIVSRTTVIRGSDIVQAQASPGEMRGWEMDFILSPAAARRVEAYTSASIGKQVAIVVDGQAVSVPTIQSTISDRGRISGAKTEQEAADLAMVLKAPLPVRLLTLEERMIGPVRTPNGR